ncbi:hypothetical protein KXJ72_12910 [Comamonas aquatica]|nr:hypothetical protein KXJ72_12910 [Comamonas aquatica]
MPANALQCLFKSMRYNAWGASGMNRSQAERPEAGLRCDVTRLKKF